MITKEMIERAKRQGLNVSWAENMPQVTGPQEQITPQVQQVPGGGFTLPSPVMHGPAQAGAARTPLHDLIDQVQRDISLFVPYEPGAPTQRRREFEEGIRQFDVAHEEGVRQFDLGFDMAEREFEEGIRQFDLGYALDRDKFVSDDAYRNAQIALQRETAQRALTAVPGGMAFDDLLAGQKQMVGPQIAAQEVNEFVRMAVGEGSGWDDVKSILTSPQTLAQYGIYYVDEPAMLQMGAAAFEQAIREVVKARPAMTGPGDVHGPEYQARQRQWKEVEKAWRDVDRILGRDKKEEEERPLGLPPGAPVR